LGVKKRGLAALVFIYRTAVIFVPLFSLSTARSKVLEVIGCARQLIGQAVAFDLRILRRRRLIAEGIVDPVLRLVEARLFCAPSAAPP
jgi:hypothetical protein